MTTQCISRDERPLGQLVWWLMFLGWTPMLVSYAYVLDPITTLHNGALFTFTHEVTLYPQRGFGHPAIGVLTIAALLQALAIWRLGWRALWPLPVFLLASCFIHVFNGPGVGTPLQATMHLIYAVFAFWAAFLFLRHGHVMSLGFGAYVALLLLDVLLREQGLDHGLLGFVFHDYTPNLVTAALFVVVTILVRMVWLIVRDNRTFIRSLQRVTLRRALGRTLCLWWPMPVIFLVFGIGWWAVGAFGITPTALSAVQAQTRSAEADLNAWLKQEQARPPLKAAQQQQLASFMDFTRAVADLQRRIREEKRASGHVFGVFHTEVLLQHQAELQALRQGFKPPPSHAPEIARQALLADTAAAYDTWREATPTAEDPLERATRRLTELQTLLTGAQTQLAIVQAGQKAESLDALPATVRRELDRELFPRSALPLMRVPRCFPVAFLDPVCSVKASLARTGNTAMVGLRQDMIDGVVETLEGPATEGARTVDEAMLKSLAETRLHFADVAAAGVTTIKSGFQTWRNVSLLAGLYSLIVLFKTLMIVFSRVIFSPKVAPDVVAPFLPEDHPQGQPQLARHAQVLRIPVDDPDGYFVSRWGVTLEGPPPARRRPLGLRFPLVRILTGTWAMNRIDGARSKDDHEFDADLKVDEPAELVSWRLRPGEQVVFRFHDVVGIGDTVTVRRVVSLSLTTLMLGRMIYYVAEGPGVLILRTTAAARISSDPEAHRPAPMPKLVAWAADTRFGILASQTTADTFLSGYNLKTGDADTVIWDTSTRRGNGPGTGILRFVKSFLLPI